MHQARTSEDNDRLWSLYQAYLPLIVFEQQPGVAVRKEIFRRRGLIEHNTVRSPATSLSTLAANQLGDLINRVFSVTDITQPLIP